MEFCVHGRTGWCEWCNSELEDLQDRSWKANHRVMVDEEARQRFQSDLEFSRKPRWLQEQLEGDRDPRIDNFDVEEDHE